MDAVDDAGVVIPILCVSPVVANVPLRSSRTMTVPQAAQNRALTRAG